MSELDQLIQTLDGKKIGPKRDEEVLRCDDCAGPVTKGTVVQFYISNLEVMRGSHASFGVQRMYGPCCSLGAVKYPHKGTAELVIEATIDREWRIRDPSVIHQSPPDDGYEWDPREVWEAVFQMSYAENFIATGGMKNGPEDIVDSLSHFDVDIREVVDEEGNITIDDEMRREIDNTLQERAEEMFGGR